jgi:hypothetical protein
MGYVITAACGGANGFPVGVYSSKERAIEALEEMTKRYKGVADFYTYKLEPNNTDFNSPPITLKRDGKQQAGDMDRDRTEGSVLGAGAQTY